MVILTLLTLFLLSYVLVIASSMVPRMAFAAMSLLSWEQSRPLPSSRSKIPEELSSTSS
jgi:hypothetical protein